MPVCLTTSLLPLGSGLPRNEDPEMTHYFSLLSSGFFVYWVGTDMM
jgi:hypothetical protein